MRLKFLEKNDNTKTDRAMAYLLKKQHAQNPLFGSKIDKLHSKNHSTKPNTSSTTARNRTSDKGKQTQISNCRYFISGNQIRPASCAKLLGNELSGNNPFRISTNKIIPNADKVYVNDDHQMKNTLTPNGTGNSFFNKTRSKNLFNLNLRSNSSDFKTKIGKCQIMNTEPGTTLFNENTEVSQLKKLVGNIKSSLTLEKEIVNKTTSFGTSDQKLLNFYENRDNFQETNLIKVDEELGDKLKNVYLEYIEDASFREDPKKRKKTNQKSLSSSSGDSPNKHNDLKIKQFKNTAAIAKYDLEQEKVNMYDKLKVYSRNSNSTPLLHEFDKNNMSNFGNPNNAVIGNRISTKRGSLLNINNAVAQFTKDVMAKRQANYNPPGKIGQVYIESYKGRQIPIYLESGVVNYANGIPTFGDNLNLNNNEEAPLNSSNRKKRFGSFAEGNMNRLSSPLKTQRSPNRSPERNSRKSSGAIMMSLQKEQPGQPVMQNHMSAPSHCKSSINRNFSVNISTPVINPKFFTPSTNELGAQNIPQNPKKCVSNRTSVGNKIELKYNYQPGAQKILKEETESKMSQMDINNFKSKKRLSGSKISCSKPNNSTESSEDSQNNDGSKKKSSFSMKYNRKIQKTSRGSNQSITVGKPETERRSRTHSNLMNQPNKIIPSTANINTKSRGILKIDKAVYNSSEKKQIGSTLSSENAQYIYKRDNTKNLKTTFKNSIVAINTTNTLNSSSTKKIAIDQPLKDEDSFDDKGVTRDTYVQKIKKKLEVTHNIELCESFLYNFSELYTNKIDNVVEQCKTLESILEKTCSPQTTQRNMLFVKNGQPRDLDQITLENIIYNLSVNQNELATKIEQLKTSLQFKSVISDHKVRHPSFINILSTIPAAIKKTPKPDRVKIEKDTKVNKVPLSENYQKLITKEFLKQNKYNIVWNQATISEQRKVDKLLASIIMDKKVIQYNAVSDDLMNCLQDSQNWCTDRNIIMNKDRKVVQEQCWKKSRADIADYYITEAHKNDIVHLIESNEQRRKYKLRITEDKRFINRKCREILSKFTSKVINSQKINNKQVFTFENVAQPTKKGAEYSVIYDEEGDGNMPMENDSLDLGVNTNNLDNALDLED